MSSIMFRRVCASVRTFQPMVQSVTARSMASATGGMEFTFGSPTKAYYNKADVKQVDVPSLSGSFGILPAHVPTLASLSPGVVTVYEQSGETKQFFVSSGIVTVNDDSTVVVNAEEAWPVADLDGQAARQGLTEAQRAADSASDESARAEALISVETYEAIVKATD